MSVLASKKINRAEDVLGTAMRLYRNTARIVLNKDIVPPQLSSEFRYPVTNNLRDMCSDIAVALECDPIHDYSRRTRRLMSAHDSTIIFETHMELLKSVRRIPDELILGVLTDSVNVERGLKAILAEDRMLVDERHKSSRNKKENAKNNDASLVERTEKKPENTDEKETIIQDTSSESSIEELRRRALENSESLQGIINDPTEPCSPVINKVREIQKIKSATADASIRKGRVRRSSH